MWREWLSYHHWSYMIRHSWLGTIRRAIYGWSPVDTWSFDRYLAHVIAPALRHMATHTHGYPIWILEEYPEFTDLVDGTVDDEAAEEAWQHWLLEKATWFEWYTSDDLELTPEMTDEQKLAQIDKYEHRMDRFKHVILPDFCAHFDSLWD